MKSAKSQFLKEACRFAADDVHRQWVHAALSKYEVTRDQRIACFGDWPAARRAASEIKRQALANLDTHLEQFARLLESRGTKVHWARDGAEACRIIQEIAAARGAKVAIKSKSMTSEEIHLNQALQEKGLEVIESDLGEYIVQLRGETPYHIVFPAMHLRRGQISELFQKELGSPPTDSPEELTMIARRAMRKKFLQADLGITGANFAVAETGMISVTENEGNSRLTAALPKAMITLVGIEKIVPRLADLAMLLPMLATVGAAQLISGYNTLYSGPRQPGESDGPEEYHVVLLDNRRTALLADPEQRDALHCIRCGGCLNVCPVFRNIGGHTYGTPYSGPIGSVITPHLRGLLEYVHLSYASSLCGACAAACPVRIPISSHLLQNRRNAVRLRGVWMKRLMFRFLVLAATRPWIWRLATRAGRIGQVLHWLVRGTFLDPAYSWTRTRELPRVAKQTFKEWWRSRP